MNKYSSRIMSVAFVLLFGIAIFTVIIPQDVNASIVTENFDSYVNGSLPCNPTPIFAPPCSGTYFSYSQSSSGSISVQSTVKEGTTGNSLRMAGSPIVNLKSGAVDICVSGIRFAIAFAAATSTSMDLWATTDLGVGSPSLSFTGYTISLGLGSSGTATLIQHRYVNAVDTTTATPAVIFASTLLLNTFYHFNIYCPVGASAGTFVLVAEEAAGPVSATGLSNTGTNFATNTYFIAVGIPSGLFIDNLSMEGSASTIPAIGSIASRGVTSLSAFDADPYNQVIMSRSVTTGSNSLINSYDSNSATLATRATAITSTCNQVDGIMAYSPTSNGKQFASWVDCDSGHTVVNNFRIRSGTLSNPDQSGTACTGNTICDIDMSGSDVSLTSGCASGYQLPNGALQLGNIQAIPVDWTTGSQTGINHVEVGFAFSNAANGNIGTWTIRQQTGVDDSCRVEVPFSSPSQTIEICSWRNQLDGNDYIAAIGSSSPTSAWQYHLTPYSTFNTELDTSLTAIPASLPAPYNHLIGIACVDNDALVMDTSGNYARVHIIGSNVGGVVWGPIALGGSAINRGTAISRDNKWGLIASTTSVKVINALTGATTCSITMPSGNFKEERISYSGQVAWIATDTTIAKYDIHSCTSISPVVDGCVITNGVQTCYDSQGNIVTTGGPTNTGTGTSTITGGTGVGLNTADNILGINIGATATGLNISRNSVLLLIAVVIMGVFGIWLYRNTDSIMGLVLGILLGFLLSVAMGLILEWVMITLVLVLLIILGKMFFGGFYPGSGDE